jgi:hypothetical protein
MTDLAEWLLAQYDADEQRERSKWRKPRLDGRDCPCCGRTITGTIWNGSHERTWWTLEPCMHELSDEEVERIAPPVSAADPFVLADLAAKRRIVKEHRAEEACSYHPKASEYPFGCTTCHRDPECGYVMALGWCQTVRLLALPYAGHDGYDERWRPEE